MVVEFVSDNFGYRRNKASALREGRAIRENARVASEVDKLSTPDEIKKKLTLRLINERKLRDDKNLR